VYGSAPSALTGSSARLERTLAEPSGAGPWVFFDHGFTNLPPLAYVTGRISFVETSRRWPSPDEIVDLCTVLA